MESTSLAFRLLSLAFSVSWVAGSPSEYGLGRRRTVMVRLPDLGMAASEANAIRRMRRSA